MYIIEILQYALGKATQTFLELWPLLLLSIVISVALKLYVDKDSVANFLRRNQRNSVAMSTVLAVGTPFCSCGTTAVVLGMIASTVPWAPIVAFIVASPLTSPQEMVYSAGLFGWPFAIAFMASSIVLGLAGGAIAGFADSRGWLKNQARFAPKPVPVGWEQLPVTDGIFREERTKMKAADTASKGRTSRSPFINLLIR